jgi:hypothetical protein
MHYTGQVPRGRGISTNRTAIGGVRMARCPDVLFCRAHLRRTYGGDQVKRGEFITLIGGATAGGRPSAATGDAGDRNFVARALSR